MYATNFEFAGEKLSDYGMIICSFNDPSDVETVSSGSDITLNQIKSSSSNRFFICSHTYESSYTTTFQICKNPCLVHSQDKMVISTEEISAIQRWLCRKQYCKFKIYQNNYENLYWNAVFSTKQINLNGKIIGMELTLYTDAPFAYMDEITIEKNCSINNYSFDIFDVSDEEGFIYPDVKITFLENGKFVMGNSCTPNKFTEISNCSYGECITLHGDTHIIESSLNRYNLSQDFNYFFPKIINTYTENKNTFTCNLKCKITISYSPIRKVGL